MPLATQLLHSQARILRQLLVDLGVGTNPEVGGDWPVFDYGEPGDPDNVITCYNTSNQEDGRDMISGRVNEQYGAQIRMRATDPTTGEAKMMPLPDLLNKTVSRTRVTVSGTDYCVHCVSTVNGGVIAIGKESPTSKRNLWTLNVLMTVTLD